MREEERGERENLIGGAAVALRGHVLLVTNSATESGNYLERRDFCRDPEVPPSMADRGAIGGPI